MEKKKEHEKEDHARMVTMGEGGTSRTAPTSLRCSLTRLLAAWKFRSDDAESKALSTKPTIDASLALGYTRALEQCMGDIGKLLYPMPCSGCARDGLCYDDSCPDCRRR
jgi:hypothetical protein